MRNRLTACILAGLLCASACSRPQVVSPHVEKTAVTDLAGRQVVIPRRIKRTACFSITSYEKVVLLGEEDTIAIATLPNQRTWARRIDPNHQDQPQNTNLIVPNVEEFLRRRIDLVFYENDPIQLNRLQSVGLPSLVSLAFGSQDNRPVHDIPAFTGIVKDEVQLFGHALSASATARAEDWVKYYDGKVRFVMSRIASVPQNRRPRVYNIKGPGVLNSYGQKENSPWYVTMAGGRMVTWQTTQGGSMTVSIEQLLLWNPDVIFIGHSESDFADRRYSPRIVTDDPRLKSLKAVKNGRIYVFPAGVDSWDLDSEGVLLMLYVAKKLYPERFFDLDMVAEVKNYYRRFYRSRLTDDDAKRMLGED